MKFSEIYVEDCLKYITDFTTGWSTSGIVKWFGGYNVPDNSEVIFKFSNGLDKTRCGLGNGSGSYTTVWYPDNAPYQGHTYTYMYNKSGGQILHETVTSITSDDEISVRITGTTATWYKNGVQQDTGTIPSQTNNIRFVNYSYFTPTYIKVKPL